MQSDALSSALRLVQRQYLQLVDIRRFQLPESSLLCNESFQQQLIAVVFHPVEGIPAPPARYTHQVLKLIVENILEVCIQSNLFVPKLTVLGIIRRRVRSQR